MKIRRNLASHTALAVAAAAAFGVTPSQQAHALGLGRMSVQSALGEGLLAEIDVTNLSAEEAATLTVRVASPEAYRAAGVEYNAVLTGVQATLMRRADGRPYLKLSTDRAMQEPYVEAILDVTSSSGRLRREYTMLFDPPGTRTAAASPAAAPIVAAAPAPRTDAGVRTAAERPTAAKAAAAAGGGGDRYEVREGDSLSRIALSQRPTGVSLDQMLAALYRANPDAFIARNINKLKAGVVLSVPSAENAKSLSNAEAKRLIVAQSADFGAYRGRLAESVPAAPSESPKRSAQGKVQATVEDRTQAAMPSADKLRLSGGAVTTPASAPAVAATRIDPNDLAARIAELSRSIEELKRLQQAQAGSTAVAAAPVKPASAIQLPAAAPASAALPAPAVVPAPTAASAPASAAGPSTPVPALAPPAVAAASAEAAAPPAAKPSAAAPAPTLTPAPKVRAPEPGLLDSLTESPFLLPGIGLLVLLAGGGAVAWRMRGRFQKSASETSFLESKMQPDSFFGASGGQRVDTRDATTQGSTSIGYSLSQLDAIGDVDPVAEADVYLAYGRDLQAEEILKEALRATPERMAIRTKLLEVYAKRRDTKGFELLASQLYHLAKGGGPDWEKAQELGRQIDPDNPLYQSGGKPSGVVVRDQLVTEPLDAPTLPQSTFPPSGAGALTEPAAMPKADSAFDLDLDLDLSQPSFDPMAQTQPLAAVPSRAAPVEQTTMIDFDIAPTIQLSKDEPRTITMPRTEPQTVAMPRPPMLPEEPTSIRMDLEPSPVAPLSLEPEATDSTINFDNFSLSESPSLSDGSTLSGAVSTSPNHLSAAGAEETDPLARKFELAEEFRQIGDLEGARDLLEEVVAKATGALKSKAQAMLDDLG